MKKPNFRQAEEGTTVEEVCRKAGISFQTYYRWRKKYGGLMPSEMKRLRQIEEENNRLKRIREIAETRVRWGYGRIHVLLRREGGAVVETLRRVTAVHGVPAEIRPDNGPEFVSKDLDLWAWSNGVKLDFSRPGKPTDNAFIESFNASFRAGTKCARSHSA